MKLSDTQLVLLSTASQHGSRAVILAPDLKGSAAIKVVGGLLREKLVEEIPANGSLPVWRRDEDDSDSSRPSNIRACLVPRT